MAAPATARPSLASRLGLGATAGSAFNPWLMVPAILFLAGFFIMPLVQNAERSFRSPNGSFYYYEKLLTDPFYLGVTGATVALSAAVTAICVIVGYPIAWFLVRRAGRWSSLVIFMLIAPLLTTIIMRSFGWRVLLTRRGLVNTMLLDLGLIDRPLNMLNTVGAVVAGLVHVLVPFMVLSIASVLQSVSPRLEESARILGAGRIATFFLVTLPLTIDGIGTGAIVVFMLANGSFITLLLLGAGSMQTLPLLIYQQFNTTRDFGFAAAMSNVLLVLAVGCLYVQLRLVKRRGVKQ